MENITQEQAQPAIKHMNEDHGDANVIYVRAWGGINNAVEATMKTITNKYMTFDVLDSSGKSHNDIKVEFEKPLNDIKEAHKTLVDMVGLGRKKLTRKSYTEQDILQFVDDLTENSNIIHISTVDKQGQPALGYTQFVGNQNKVYVLMSEMTGHTMNILNGNEKCSVMFTQNENDADNLAALERFMANAIATEIPYEDKLFDEILNKMIDRQGEIIGKMAKMADFHMFELTIGDGRYVKGFGLIFDRKDGTWGRARGGGHRKRK